MILLVNLTIEQLEQRLNISFSADDKATLQSMRQQDVSVPIAHGKFHIFDIPFAIQCSDTATIDTVVSILTKFDTSKFPEAIRIIK